MRTNVNDRHNIPDDRIVSVLGGPKAFSGQAAKLLQLQRVNYVKTMGEVRDAKTGLLPVYNYSSSGVDENIEALMKTPGWRVVADVLLEVRMRAIGLAGTRRESITEVYSQQQGLLQCSEWINGLAANPVRHSVASTTEAIDTVERLGRTDAVALGPGEAVTPGRNLEILDIDHGLGISNAEQNGYQNATHFLVIEKHPRQNLPLPGMQRHLCIVTPANKPGTLHDMTAPFARQNADLFMEINRPIGVKNGKQYYRFLFGWDQKDGSAEEIYRELNALEPLDPERYPTVQWLGSWNTHATDPQLTESLSQ